MSVPTLTAGLTAVTSDKGDIDVALLSEIISRKQDEVRREFLQTQIYASMEGSSFALKNFIYSSFNALLTLKDGKAIEKELLTQVTILSLHAGVAETLLRFNFQKDGTMTSEMSDALKEFISLKYPDASLDFEDVKKEVIRQISKTKFSYLFHVDKFINDEVVRQLGESNSTKYSEGKIKKKYKFSSLLLDCIFEACRNNKKLEELGFVKIHPDLKPLFVTENVYFKIDDQYLSSDIGKLQVYNYIEKAIGLLVDYHPLFLDFMNDMDISINTIADLVDEENEFSKTDFEQMTAAMFDKTSAGLNAFYRNTKTESIDIEQLKNEITDIEEGISDFKRRMPDVNPRVNINDYLFIKDRVIPLANKMLALGIFENSDIKQLTELRSIFYVQLLGELTDSLENDNRLGGLLKAPMQDYSFLIRIISSLSSLDKIRSYEHLFNTLTQIGIGQVQNSESRYLRDLLYFIESYTSIDLNTERIHVEVEPLLLKLLSLYESRANRNTQLYFGVGLNQTLDVQHKGHAQYALTGKDSMEISSMGFASEKIGLKYKLIDVRKIRSLDIRELKGPKKWFRGSSIPNRKPVINDLFVFAYGSGLLYNVANLTTEGDSFDYSMAGFGLGVSFFNSLDLAIWRSSPLGNGYSFGESIKNRSYIGFSFEVKLTEYLSELGKKRRLAKIEE
jgi:hypothetical protein